MTTHHRFPKSLLTLEDLEGGDFGTLEVTALDRNTVQIELGGDYVALDRSQWAAVRAAIDPLFGVDLEVDVTATTDNDGDEVVDAEVVERVPPARPRRRRTAAG
jgi:hypothetical protein